MTLATKSEKVCMELWEWESWHCLQRSPKGRLVLDSSQGSPILVHDITCKGHKFITVAYGWPEGRPVVQPVPKR